jgi:hypothetical protein
MTEGEKTYSQKDIDFHMAKYEALESEVKEFRTKFKGFDPEEYKAIKEERDALKIKGSIGSEEEIKARINEAVGEEKKRLETAYNEEKTAKEQLAAELKKERVTKNVLQAVAPHATADGLKLLTPILEKESDWVDGKIVFKDENGKPRYSPTDATKLLSETEFVESLKTVYPSAFQADAQKGTKNGITKINPGSSTEITSLGQLSKLSQTEQKTILNQMAKDNPKGLNALLSKTN